jgi:hypothetical protein
VNKVTDQNVDFVISSGGKLNRGFAAFKRNSEINIGRGIPQ